MRQFPGIVLAGLMAAVCASGTVRATELDLSVNSDALRLGADFDLSNNLRVGGSWLYHQDKGYVATADAYVIGNAAPGIEQLQAGVGLQLMVVDSDEGSKEDGFGVPLSGFVNYTLPRYDRISFGGSLQYAPGVLSYGDLDSYFAWNLWAGYDLIRDATVYLGARGVKPEFEDGGSMYIDTGMHFGVRIRLR